MDCSKARNFAGPVKGPCVPGIVKRFGQKTKCLACRKPVAVDQETCPHDLRFSNEAREKKDGCASFCGRCGAALRGRVCLPTDFQRRWGEGKVLSALPPGHPDYLHTNQKSALAAAKRHGIDVNTGTFKDEAARQKAWKDVSKLRDWSRNHVGVTPGGSNEGKRLKVPRIHPGMGAPAKPLQPTRKTG